MNWSLQMVMALEFVHKKEVLHRDIKPSNILLFEDGRVLKLCDFGTARKLEHTLTNAVGTVLYMAPEVIKNAKPFIVGLRNKGVPVHSIMFKIAEGGRPPMIQNLPQCLADLLHKCWSDDCTKRPSMGEIREKLSRLAKRVGLHLNMPLVKRRKEIRKLVSVPAPSHERKTPVRSQQSTIQEDDSPYQQ
ncbi:Mitogen-activated protein kinase kinase kinase 7 [Geodia barretti]|uniref:Mitogen-activated protein kinase kinase kinase 7 n=1 Tax=Geodia barretti TaxID=519541 RepID=A0AA35RCV4_GEOBA|nr:Mitogen-activated protein kinase kinase kinase 7 [Geodia barretti]